jgi:hypothetical protein
MPIPKFGLAHYQDMLFGTERVLWWLCSRLDLPRLIRYDRRTVAEKTATESQVVRNTMFAIEKRTRDTALKRYYGRKILAGEGDLLLWIHKHEKTSTHEGYATQDKWLVLHVNIVSIGSVDIAKQNEVWEY